MLEKAKERLGPGRNKPVLLSAEGATFTERRREVAAEVGARSAAVRHPAAVAAARVPFLDNMWISGELKADIESVTIEHRLHEATDELDDRARAALEELLDVAKAHEVEAYEAFFAHVLSGYDRRSSRPAEDSLDASANLGEAIDPDTSRAAMRDVLTHLLPNADPAALEAFALAAHPWRIDVPSILISTEVSGPPQVPTRTPYAVAADRLLRLAAAIRSVNPHAAANYDEAARVVTEADQEELLGESAKDDPLAGLDTLIESPWGLEPPWQASAVARERESDPERDRIAADTALHLMRAAVRARAADLGVALGGRPSGTGVHEAVRALGCRTITERIEDGLAQLDPREQDIAVNRLFPPPGRQLTLQKLGERWSLTRERMRQLCLKLEERMQDTELFRVLDELANMLRDATPPVVRVEILKGLIEVLGGSDGERGDLIFGATGPWEVDGDWAWRTEDAERVTGLLDDLRTASDEYDIVAPDAVKHARELNLLDQVDFEPFLFDHGFSRVGDLYTSKDTSRARVAAALRHIGRPATKDEISALLPDDHPRTGANVLSSLEGVVRADKERWGYREWIEDVYEGIPGEIAQRIDEHGGAVPIELLVEELPRLFGVAETSVRSYANTPAFTISPDGLVQHATRDSFEPIDPSEVPDTELISAGWGQVVRLTTDNVDRGFSILVSAHVAYANGVRLGDSLRVPLHVQGTDAEAPSLADDRVSVIWRPTSVNGKPEVGRAAAALRAAGISADEYVLVVPTPEGVSLLHRERPPSAVGDEHPGVAPHHVTLMLGSHEEDLPALVAKSGNAWFATAIDGEYVKSGVRIPTVNEEPLPDHVMVGLTRLPFGPVPLYSEEAGGYVDGEHEDFDRTRLAEGEVVVGGVPHHARIKVTRQIDNGWHLTARVYPGKADGLRPLQDRDVPPVHRGTEFPAAELTDSDQVEDPLFDLLSDPK